MGQTIEELIEIAQQTGELDLSNRGLTEVPERIRELRGLRVLILGDYPAYIRWILDTFYWPRNNMTAGEGWVQFNLRYILSLDNTSDRIRKL